MKVNFDVSRIGHLVLLIGLSWGGSSLLVRYLEWTHLSAFAFCCTMMCQLSNVVLNVWNHGTPFLDGNDSASAAGAAAPKRSAVGNPKKMKKLTVDKKLKSG
jgi:hypothetical protein